VTGQILTGAEQLSTVYGDFLTRLRNYAIIRDLDANDQVKVADFTTQIETLRTEASELVDRDRDKWEAYALRHHINVGNRTQYIAWSNAYGYRREIQIKLGAMRQKEALRKRILDRQYTDPQDRKIIEAEFEYLNPFQTIRYPIYPDYEYDDGANFSATYLASLPPGNGIFDDRRILTYDKSLPVLKTGTGGAFTATFDRTTQRSESITTDWSAGASVRYGFIKVSATASEHTSIQDDFRKGLSIELSAKSVYKANIIYPRWFDPTLFNHKHVKANIRDFEEFFGEHGTLLYYPTAAIIIRGFAVAFNSSQNWQFDYERKFSASAGGGFNAFGVNFGGNGTYSKHEKKHEVDQSNTKLTITDGDDTLRFVGLAVKKNKVFETAIREGLKKAFPKGLGDFEPSDGLPWPGKRSTDASTPGGKTDASPQREKVRTGK
jgi:hypothetical protein